MMSDIYAVLCRLLFNPCLYVSCVQKGEKVLIAAHGNSLRALVKYLDKMSDADIMATNIPTGKSCSLVLIVSEGF